MIRSCYLKFQISFTEGVNRFLYMLRHLPFLGDRISETVFARTDVKRKLGVISLLFGWIKWLFLKLLYFGLLLLLPALLLNGLAGVAFTDQVIWSFLVLNCFGGSRMNSQLFSSDPSDALMLHLMHMNPGQHFCSKLLIYHGSQFLFYATALSVYLTGRPGVTPVLVLRLLLFYLAFRPIGEAFLLKLNDTYGMPLDQHHKGWARGLVVCNILLLAAAYGLPVLLHDIVLWKWILAWPVVLPVCALGILSFWYLKQYPRYGLLAKRIVTRSEMEADEKLLNLSLAAESAEQISEDTEEQAHAHLFEEKEGYEYLNAIFFHRHKKLMLRRTRIKSGIVGAVLGILALVLAGMQICFSAADYETYMETAWDMVQRLLPILVFGMYCASSGQSLTRAMFYNCDKSLLKYGYYRTPQSILENFRIRLRYMIRGELPLMLVFSIGLLVDLSLMRQMEHWLQILSIIACVILLTIFYSVLYLCMYYIFQPYTAEGTEIGAGYKFCSSVIYLASYGCMQIDTLPVYFAAGVFTVMMVSLAAAYFAAWKLAPKRFVLK